MSKDDNYRGSRPNITHRSIAQYYAPRDFDEPIRDLDDSPSAFEMSTRCFHGCDSQCRPRRMPGQSFETLALLVNSWSAGVFDHCDLESLHCWEATVAPRDVSSYSLRPYFQSHPDYLCGLGARLLASRDDHGWVFRIAPLHHLSTDDESDQQTKRKSPGMNPKGFFQAFSVCGLRHLSTGENRQAIAAGDQQDCCAGKSYHAKAEEMTC